MNKYVWTENDTHLACSYENKVIGIIPFFSGRIHTPFNEAVLFNYNKIWEESVAKHGYTNINLLKEQIEYNHQQAINNTKAYNS